MPLTRREFLAAAALTGLSACRDNGMSPTTRPYVWGKQGLRHGEFQHPRAIGAWREEVYVIDTTGRIQVFDFDGAYRRGWSTPDSENGTPTGLAFSSQNTLLIPDTHYSQIIEYSPEGSLIRRWGKYGTGEDEFIYPTDIVQAPDNNYYISEYGLGAQRIHVFDADGRFARQWGGPGDGAGEFSRAMAIDIDSQGTLHVADTANHRVQCFRLDGTFLRTVGEGGAGPGQLKFPYDVTVAPDDSVLVSEYGNHRISRFTSNGAFAACYGKPGRAPGEFDGPRGVAVAENGLVFVADTDNHRVQRVPLEVLC